MPKKFMCLVRVAARRGRGGRATTSTRLVFLVFLVLLAMMAPCIQSTKTRCASIAVRATAMLLVLLVLLLLLSTKLSEKGFFSFLWQGELTYHVGSTACLRRLLRLPCRPLFRAHHRPFCFLGTHHRRLRPTSTQDRVRLQGLRGLQAGHRRRAAAGGAGAVAGIRGRHSLVGEARRRKAAAGAGDRESDYGSGRRFGCAGCSRQAEGHRSLAEGVDRGSSVKQISACPESTWSLSLTAH